MYIQDRLQLTSPAATLLDVAMAAPGLMFCKHARTEHVTCDLLTMPRHLFKYRSGQAFDCTCVLNYHPSILEHVIHHFQYNIIHHSQ